MLTTYKELFARQLLPNYYREQDSFKDQDNKGFLERFLEIFGQELDDYTVASITELQNLANPLILGDAKFLEYYSFKAGDLDVSSIGINEATYRNLLTYALSIYKVKGTLKSYKAILGIIGITDVVLNAYEEVTNRYDQGLLYDSGVLYDEALCLTCFRYDIVLEGTQPITGQLYNSIKALVRLVEPIYAKLEIITYNQIELAEAPITIEIDEQGNLIYDNTNDPDLILTLSADGDLLISGANAALYFVDDEGNLIYINENP